MAASHQLVTYDPTVVAGLNVGTTYQVQMLGGGTVAIEQASSTPARDSLTANVLAAGEYARVHNRSGESLYVWSIQSGNAQRLVINETIHQ